MKIMILEIDIGIQHEKGHIKGVQAHMEGIKRMVNMRGGLLAIRTENPVVSNIIYG